MILIEFLLAPTVPSEPKPQNMQFVVPSGSVTMCSSTLIDLLVTSSSIPTVNPWKPLFSACLYTARTIDGVNSLEDKP